MDDFLKVKIIDYDNFSLTLKKIIMKGVLFFLSIAIVCNLCSCASSQQENNDELPTVSAASVSPHNGIIPDTVRYYTLVFQPSAYTWKDFDNYYRTDIPLYHANQPYTVNLKKATIYGMVNTGKINEIEDVKVMEWYTLELLSLELPDADILIKLFDQLNGYWTNEKIQQMAEVAHTNISNYVRQNTKNPEEALSKIQPKLDRLMAYAERKN